ncbi:MAG: CBS domain-containing protein [Peptococcaceae bacterium]|nr:MAG: CBS domain-containing protein [Peptococcaceae bacterium]
MPERLAKEIMIPVSEYSTVRTTDTLTTAIKVLRASFKKDERGVITGHRSLLVLDEDNELVGILTIRSILKAIEYRSLGPAWVGFTLIGSNVINKGVNMEVREVMRPVYKPYVKTDDKVTHVTHVMLTNKTNILPVIEKGKLVGIIRAIDIFDIIGELLGSKEV